MDEVYFYHLRLKQLNENLDMVDLMPGGRMPRDCKSRVIGNRAATIALFCDNEYLCCSIAPCTWKDNFSRKKGREWATEYIKQGKISLLISLHDLKRLPIQAIEYKFAGELRELLQVPLFEGHAYVKVSQLQHPPKINSIYPFYSGWNEDFIDFIRNVLIKRVLAWRNR